MILNNDYLEKTMIIFMIVCSILCAYTDIVKSVIRNKVLIFFLVFSFLLNIYYYTCLNSGLALRYVINIVMLSIFSILFYSMHIWSAGDSKFLIVIMSYIPIQYYSSNNYEINSTIVIIIIFSISFIYVILESVFLGIKNKDFLKVGVQGIKVLEIIKQYVKCSFFILIVNMFLGYVNPLLFVENYQLVMMINMLLIMYISKVEVLNNNILIVLMAIVVVILNLYSDTKMTLNIKTFLFILLVMILSFICEKYNYMIIETEKIKEGMVLARATIYNFSLSKLSNLPHYTTEDLRSKLGKREVEAIIKWKDTKYGMKKILIVRKMPFALFISFGTILFIIFSFNFLYY